ncbi:hypothetical protein [Companilactobacillus ginsenosidimutans]|uniref:HTH merR-type domain-containing protein n=1 Tax=Companilactobacillus ginsenosidimutans TaxID=1007676 RepID=A0A0H4QHZ6_9LACO|nr:hypothetical protein [Companilactobacillus ginsenosidimutans]AKP68034.1 hypothetical protein ABM34_11150 [Companilactobacillus ginsenosidimutans]
MTNTKTNKFLTPAQAADILGISVATLRKYSLIVEHSTNDGGYFERNKQNNRLYTQKNLDDFNKMVELGHGPKMTLQTAAAQIYPVSDAAKATNGDNNGTTHNAQVANLENTIKELRANIEQQDRVIQNLSKKVIKLQEGKADDNTKSEKDTKYSEYLAKVRDAKAKKDKADSVKTSSSSKDGENSKLQTLVNMQVGEQKKGKHWWDRFMK